MAFDSTFALTSGAELRMVAGVAEYPRPGEPRVLAAAEIEQFGSSDKWDPIFADEDACRRLFEQWI